MQTFKVSINGVVVAAGTGSGGEESVVAWLRSAIGDFGAPFEDRYQTLEESAIDVVDYHRLSNEDSYSHYSDSCESAPFQPRYEV